MYRTIYELQEGFKKGTNIEYLFFWGHTISADGVMNASCLSQWYPCSFEVDGVKYATTEQYMMAGKARLFNDPEVLQQILETYDPKTIKALGRKVKHFQDDIWEKNRVTIVTEGNVAKFSQNKFMREFLLATKNKILVEASPYDRIWGIGMGKENKNAKNPLKWRGKNFLGFALMEVRERIQVSLNE